MSVEQNKDVFRRVIEEGFNNGNLDALNECFPPTYTVPRRSALAQKIQRAAQSLDRCATTNTRL